MTDALDKVVFDLDGNMGPLKAKYAEVDAETTRLATSIKSKLDAAYAAGFAGPSGVAPANVNAAKNIADAMRQLNPAAAAAGGAMREMGAGTSTATREFRALFDELSGGRTRMVPGTLAIIATRVFGLSLATIAWGVAIAAIPVAWVAAQVAADNALAKIRMGLAATGNATGATIAQIQQMSGALAASRGISPGSAQGVEMALAAHGNVPQSQLGSAGQAAVTLSQLTGEKLGKASEELEAALAKPVEGAKHFDESIKLLSAAQTREIDDLVARGESEKAAQIIVDALNARQKDAAESAGFLSNMLRGAGEKVGAFWAALGHLGGAGLSPQDQLARVQGNIQQLLPALNAPGSSVVARNQILQLTHQAAELQAQIAREAGSAQAGQTQTAQDKAIQAALSLESRWDVAGKKLREHKDDVAGLTKGLAAANAQYDHLVAVAGGKNNPAMAGQIAAADENRRQIAISLANAQNPNYNPNGGVPKGRRERDIGENPYYRQAQTGDEQLKLAEQVAATDERDRKSVEAKAKAELEYQRNLLNPKAAPYAAQIRDTQIAMAAFTDKARRADTLANAQAEVQAQDTVADAYKRGTAAGLEQVAMGEAHRAWIKGEIDDERAYTTALLQRAAAAARTATAEAINKQGVANTSLAGIVAAGGSPGAIAAAQRVNEATAQVQAERDAAEAEMLGAKTAGEKAQAQRDLNQATSDYVRILGQLIERDAQTAGVASNKQDESLRTQIQQQQLELQYKYADAELRAKEMADLEATLQLKQEGWTADMAGYQAELAARRQLLQIAAQQNLVLQGQTKDAQIMDTLRGGLEKMALTGVQGFKGLKQAAADFITQLAELALKLYVIEPLLNMLLGKSAGGGGGLLGGLFGGLFGGGGGALPAGNGFGGGTGIASLFGGGLAAGGQIDPGKFYLVGENGPELFGPGASGQITPIAAPSAQAAGSGPQQQNVVMRYEIAVHGQGDTELLAKMHAVASQTVGQGLKDYGRIQARTQRGQIVQQNRRVLA